MSKSKNAKSTTVAAKSTEAKAPRVRKPAAPKPEVAAPVAPAPVVAAPVEPAKPVDTSKRTIEKDRPEQNGVKQPSAGGMCRAVWDFCTSASATTLVTAAQVKEAAAANGWNPNNAMIEYYQWRKFNGIRGRQAKAPAAPAAQ